MSGRAGRRLAATCALGVLVLGGCTYEAGIPTGVGDPVPGATRDACALLTADELEVAVNGVVGTATAQARPVLAGMAMCSRQSQKRDVVVSWGLVTSQPDSEDGDAVGRYRRWHAGYTEDVALSGVDGARAVWDERLGTVVAEAGGRVVAVRMTAAGAGATDGRTEPGFRSRAADLAARALRRLS